MPRISVLLPVRNALPYLDASLASLWRQTFRDFEVIAVDDGSTDGSGEALEAAARGEPRLRVVRAAARGLPHALNAALARARAPFLARQDADDLSHRRRLELQLETLRAHPRVAVVGCRVRLFPEREVGIGMRRWVRWHNGLMTHDAMASEILIDSTLVHGTALMRRSWIERIGGWRDRVWAEDVDLWLRLLETGARFAKRPETLYGWRQHPGSATRRDPRYARDRLLELKVHALERGLLRRRATVTLVGVGGSLAAWLQLLRGSRDVVAVLAGAPHRRLAATLYPPVVLVFGSPEARARWRAALSEAGLREGREFIFVA
jgi:glycosyltransferase involved in cell wall biosynthesis